MVCLLDTNILLRSIKLDHPMHPAAVEAMKALVLRKNSLVIVPQVIVEFWAVCTRPGANNELGLKPAEASVELSRIESNFQILPESSVIFDVWRELVARHEVSGVQAHDARIVAAMIVHGISSILTFNDKDFRRFHEINVLTPQSVLQGTAG